MSNNTKNQEVKLTEVHNISKKNLFNQKDLFKFIKDNKND